MAIIQTPIGVLETSIPTIYGEKMQFRTFDGNSFDIPDWVAWFALIAGLGIGGFVTWKARDVFDVGKSIGNFVGGARKRLDGLLK
jgi:hypothetical protein